MTNNELVLSFFMEGYERMNYDYVMSILSDDYIDSNPAGAKGNAGAVNILMIVAEQFSDLKIEDLDIFSCDEMVATRIR